MGRYLVILFVLTLILSAAVMNVKSCQAGCCGCDPVYSYDAKGEVLSAVWVRDQACVTTGAIIDTLKAGEVVKITDRTDGWYKVISPRGEVGWSGEQFFSITDKPLSGSTTTTPKTTTPTEPATTSPVTNPTYSFSSLAWLKGYILLQVQDNGEAWYVDPVSFKRYYMKDGAIAYEMMRSFGLGITDADLSKIPSIADTTEMKNSTSICASNSLANRLKGKIALQVQQHGEAWYIYPKTCRRIYMKDGASAYEIMRYLGLGITNNDLSKLTADTLVEKPYTTTNEATVPKATEPAVTVTGSDTIDQTFVNAGYISNGSQIAGTGLFQKGSVPGGFNYKIVTQHILDRINYERTKRGKPAIVSDQRMADTAAVWAEQMYLQGAMTHTRVPVNMIAREWVWQNFKIGFRESWGWLYENIGGGSYRRSSGINESVMASMDDLFDFYMSEEATNGIHYQTIMHDHLTHVGVGYYFDGTNDSGNLYTVLHYGGLNGNVGIIDKTW
ncbi:MAG: CAP domain-containing protein [Candidatus Parcubacteria bacterium]|nr:CAP domain-containing protein [Candidatus Parcubacteria bacterium]